MPGKPIVIAHHLMWTAYGCWLPNDPRGSTSRTIRCDLLKELGELHHGRKAAQPSRPDLRAFYAQAMRALRHPLLRFTAAELAQGADVLGEVMEECGYTCWACAVLPDHVHLAVRKHRDAGETMIERIQALSRKRLTENGVRPADHPVWTQGGWKVFLDHPDEVWRTIRYVEANPEGYHLPLQTWSFVKPYDNWPLHEGHSPRSPYVRRLRAAGRYP